MKKFYFLISFILCLFLAACSKKEMIFTERQNAQVQQMKTRYKMGEISSHVTEVNLARLSEQPIAESEIRYANKQYQGKW
jgi:outer membrane biogenesis lipoprotein LolB